MNEAIADTFRQMHSIHEVVVKTFGDIDPPDTSFHMYLNALGRNLARDLKAWNDGLEKPNDIGWVIKKANDSIREQFWNEVNQVMNESLGFPETSPP